MELQLVSKEVAILAKELGFDWDCTEVYYEKDQDISHRLNYYEGDGSGYTTNKTLKEGYFAGIQTLGEVLCVVPEQELLTKWLRDTHNLDSIPIVRGEIKDNVAVKYYMTGFGDGNKYTKYEDCLEKILLLGLNHIKDLKLHVI